MPQFFGDHDAVITTIERWQERQRQVQVTVDSITPEQAGNITRLARMFPFVSPGVVRGLGQAGLGPDDDATQFAITQELLRNYSTTGSWSGRLGEPKRQMRHPTKTAPVSSAVGADEHRLLNSENSPQRKAAAMERAQGLLAEGETLGVFNPTTQVLVEPEFGDGDKESQAHKVFSQLQDTIYGISKSPVPYLALDGKIRGFTPEGGTTGDRELDLATGTISPDEFRPDPMVTGTLTQGGTGHVEDFGAEAQRQDSNAIISQIFADNEANAQSRIDSSRLTPQAAGFNPLNGGVAPLTPIARGTFAALDAPIQELQGLARNAYGAAHGEDVDWLESQSDAGIALPTAIRNLNPWTENTSIDLGKGLFVDPESQVARERRTREAERGQIGNHNLTIGRILANGVGMEPDTKPFLLVSGLVDGAAQLADPSAYGLGTVGDIQKSRKFFAADEGLEAAGVFGRLRRVYDGPTFQAWANKNTGIIDTLAGMDDPYEIAKLTNFKIDPDTVATLSRIRKPEDIRGFINSSIERGSISQTTQLEGSSIQRGKKAWADIHSKLGVSYTPRTARVLKMMPGQNIDLEDKVQTARTLMAAMHNVHGSEDDVAAIYNMVARAGNKNAMRDAVNESMSRAGGILDNYGIHDPEVRSWLTRTNVETHQEDLRGLIDEVGADVPTWEVIAMDGKTLNITGPHLPLEHIGRYMHLPDQRALRRLTTKFNFLTASQTDIPVLSRLTIGANKARVPEKVGHARLPIAAADWVMSEILKPSWLLRLAWPIRVVGEEQLRMASAGLDSIVRHPISYLAMVIGGEQNRLAKMVDGFTPGLAAKMEISPSGRLFTETEELGKVTYRAHGGWVDQPGVIRTNAPTIYNKNNIDEVNEWRSSWAHELALLHNDPVSNFVANHSLEDSVQWLYRQGGNKYRREMMDAHPGNLETVEQVQAYVETVVKRISRMTADHPDLLDIVKTGKWSKFKDDQEIVSTVFTDTPNINPSFTQHLRGYEDVGPDKIKGRSSMSLKDSADFPHRWGATVDRFMSVLMGTPTSTLSRSPAFRQFAWKRAAELIPYADGPARVTILANARKAGLNSRQMKGLERAALRGKKNDAGEFVGKLNADDVDMLAKGHAIDDTKELLYDLSERSQITDIMRILVPFGEAWKEVLTRWAKLATISGPGGIPLPGKAVRRGQQVIQGARGEDFGEFMGNGIDPETGKQRGFFYKNEFGQEVYTYPGSEWATAALTNVPVPLTGSVQGLNMFGTIIPGLGPVAQIPIAWFLQDKPDYDAWREKLLPFGGPGSEDAKDIFELRSYLPAWAKTAVDVVTAGGNDDRMYNSSVMYTASYLYSTGEYGDTVEEQQRLLEDAKESASELYWVRALGQFSLPSSPTFSWVTKDKDGNLLNTRILAEEFYDLQQEDYDTAIEKFLDMYGPNSIGAIVPHSRNVISAVPTSLEGAKWVANHRAIRDRYDLVYGFFAPEGEFHMRTYSQNYMTGERDSITPKQWLSLKDTLLGNYHYQRAKAMLGPDQHSPDKGQADWLRTQRRNIQEAYPNWNNSVGLAGRPTNEQMIEQLYDASKNRTVARTDAGKGLVQYLALRDQAIEQAEGAGFVSFKTANDLAPTRQWLTDNAHQIIQDHPGFERLWDVVFSREMEDAVVEPQTSGTN